MADEITDEVTLTQITYTAARSGNEFIRVPGVGPVAIGQSVWVAPDDAEYYASPLIDSNGEMTPDFDIGDEWTGTREEADEKRKPQEETAAAINKINAAGIVDAHPTVIEEESEPESTPQQAPKATATKETKAKSEPPPQPAPATDGAAV